MTAQEVLNSFYLAYFEWLEAGASEGLENEYGFGRGVGLCSNLGDFSGWGSAPYHLMLDQFKAEGLDKEYPFGGFDLYLEEQSDDTIYLNPQRIEWVAKKVAALRL